MIITFISIRNHAIFSTVTKHIVWSNCIFIGNRFDVYKMSNGCYAVLGLNILIKEYPVFINGIRVISHLIVNFLSLDLATVFELNKSSFSNGFPILVQIQVKCFVSGNCISVCAGISPVSGYWICCLIFNDNCINFLAVFCCLFCIIQDCFFCICVIFIYIGSLMLGLSMESQQIACVNFHSILNDDLYLINLFLRLIQAQSGISLVCYIGT